VSKHYKIGWKPQNYERRVASARIRCLNTLRQLGKQHFPAELYREKNEADYRIVVFSKAYTNKEIVIARRLRDRGTKIVFDLCDNHFLLGEDRNARLKEMFELADHWVVSSEALGKVVTSTMGSVKPLTVIEDAVEETLSGSKVDIVGWVKAHIELYKLDQFISANHVNRTTHIVWFGNHKAGYKDSGLAHVNKIRPVLEKVNQSDALALTVISNSRNVFDQVFTDWQLPVFYLNWSAHTFYKAMKRHKIAVIPIDVNEFTNVKTNNRIALSLFLGLGVVADGIDSYQEFSGCSFLDGWESGLRSYLEQPELLDEHVQCARRLIQEKFSIEIIAGKWRELFERI
jgi:hypothetical protein